MSQDAKLLKRAEAIKQLLDSFSDDLAKIDGLTGLANDFVDVYDGFRLAEIKLRNMMRRRCYEHECPIPDGALGCPRCAAGGTAAPRPMVSG